MYLIFSTVTVDIEKMYTYTGLTVYLKSQEKLKTFSRLSMLSLNFADGPGGGEGVEQSPAARNRA